MPELFGSVYILPAIAVVVLLLLLLLLLLVRRRKTSEAVPKPEAPKTSRKARSAAELGATPGIEFNTPEPPQQAATAAALDDPPTPTEEVAPTEPARRSGAPTDAIKDPLQLVILDILRAPGDITEYDTRRLTLFRPDKVLAATQSLELPKDLKSDNNARSRLMQLRQYATTAAERMATTAAQQPPMPATGILETPPATDTVGVTPAGVPDEVPVTEELPVVEEPPVMKESAPSLPTASPFASAYGPDPIDDQPDETFTTTFETAVTAEAIESPTIETAPPDTAPPEAAGTTQELWDSDPAESADGETIIAGEGVFFEDAPLSEDGLPPSGEQSSEWAQWQDLDPFTPTTEVEEVEEVEAEPQPAEREDLAGDEKRVEMVEEYLVESAAAAVAETEPPFSFDEPTRSSQDVIAKSIRRADDLLALPEEERKEIVAFLEPAELLKVFERTDDVELKKAIIDTLENVNNPDSLSVLRLCLDDDDPQIQMYALEAADRILGVD